MWILVFHIWFSLSVVHYQSPLGVIDLLLKSNPSYPTVDIEFSQFSAQQAQMKTNQKYGHLNVTFDAMQTIVNWNTIFDPREYVCTVFSRKWAFGSDVNYAIADWDCYFASYEAILIDKDKSFVTAIQVTRSLEERGFVPNYASGIIKSRDRSEPPIGSFVVREIYKNFPGRLCIH